MSFKVVPARKTRGNKSEDPPAETASAPTDMHVTQGANTDGDADLSADENVEKKAFPEPAPDDDTEVALSEPELPERQARMGFKAMLTQIAEDTEFDEADRTVGNYKFNDEEWESWKAGLYEFEDESEVGSDSESDGTQTQSVATKQPKGRHSKHSERWPQTQTRKGKAMTRRGSKRKPDLHSDTDTSGSESEEEGERRACCLFRRLQC